MRHVTMLGGPFPMLSKPRRGLRCQSVLASSPSVCLSGLQEQTRGKKLTHSSGDQNAESSDKWPGVLSGLSQHQTARVANHRGDTSLCSTVTRGALPGPRLSHTGAV